MRKVLELIEKNAKEKSEKFEMLHTIKVETVEETVDAYNPKTARIRSFKDLSIFSVN